MRGKGQSAYSDEKPHDLRYIVSSTLQRRIARKEVAHLCHMTKWTFLLGMGVQRHTVAVKLSQSQGR